MSTIFQIKEIKAPFLKGVIFGDSGSGKSYLAKDFALKSCEIMKINRFILLDTENGWDWIKKEIPSSIEVIEPEVQYSTSDNTSTENIVDICKLFIDIKAEIAKNPVSCIVIDSCSHIGQALYHNTLCEINKIKKDRSARYGKTFYSQLELEFQDWVLFNDKHNIVMNILRSLNCHIILCGRATSENAITKDKDDKKSISLASERTVLDWKKITYEFDFSCLLYPKIDLNNKDAFKTFETYVLKSRFSDDGKVLHNSDFLEKWFSFFEKMDFELVKSKILDAENEKDFLEARTLALKFSQQMSLEQKNEIKNIIENVKKLLNITL